MDAEAVRNYVDRSQSIIEASPQMDEENTKTKIINPLIELLGWDLYSMDVELEYTVQIATGTRKVDYALFIDDVPRVFVEAKGCDTDVEQATGQVKDYMRQELPVKWGIATNGKTIEILRKSERSESEEIRFGRYTLADLRSRPTVLDVVSKDAIVSGEDDETVNRMLQLRRAISDLQHQKEPLAEDITNLVVDRVDEVSALSLESQSKAFVDDLIASLEAKEHEITKQGDDTESGEKGEGEGHTNGGGSRQGDGALAGMIRREELEGPADAKVAVFPARPSGVKFLKDNNAWGFVKINQAPMYVAMYVTDDNSEIRYVAEVDRIVGATEADLVKPAEEYEHEAEFDPTDQVVVFKPGTLYELENPIPYKEKYPQSLRYSTLGKLRDADTTWDVF